MKFWVRGKTKGNSEDSHRDHDLLFTEDIGLMQHEKPWLLVCVTFNQILPGTDLYLCVNGRGEIGLMALPDIIVSRALGQVQKESPNSNIVLIQNIQDDKDSSYLIPSEITEKQDYIKEEVRSAFNNRQLEKILKKSNWRQIISEVIVNNYSYLSNDVYKQPISRIHVLDIPDPKQPDDNQRFPGYKYDIPVFLYSEPEVERKLNRQELVREMVVRQSLCDANFDYAKNCVMQSPTWTNMNENAPFIHVINRVEIELKLFMRARPSFADIFLDPEMSELIPGPPTNIKFTQKGQELYTKTQTRELMFSLSNWGDPNIAQVVLHVIEGERKSPKDSVTAPSIIIYKDEMGIHALPTKLFRVDEASLSIEGQSESPVFLDAIPASGIPEIDWKSIGDDSMLDWWQTDVIVKKILWLTAYNLASHSVENPEELIYSVTPIGNNCVQVALLFENIEIGAPYGFGIIKDENKTTAIPIYQSGIYYIQSDGTRVAKDNLLIKNYCITAGGERIDLHNSGQLIHFIKPIYSTIMSGGYNIP